jgi:hypothetical protein
MLSNECVYNDARAETLARKAEKVGRGRHTEFTDREYRAILQRNWMETTGQEEIRQEFILWPSESKHMPSSEHQQDVLRADGGSKPKRK